MKAGFLLILCCLFWAQPNWAQINSGAITYKVKADEAMMAQILKENSSNSKLKGYLGMLFKNQKLTLPYLFYQLDFNRIESIFYTPKNLSNDNGLNLESTAKNVGAYGIYYTDIESRKSFHQFTYIGTDVIVSHALGDFDWELTKESKIIRGYKCYKATVNYRPDVGMSGTITAWYAPDLPFQFGPMAYGGLPGLILELKQGYYTFTAQKIKLSKKEKQIEKPEKGKPLTAQAFKQERKKVKARFIDKQKAD